MTTWQKFLKETIPSRKTSRKLQLFVGYELFKRSPEVSRVAKRTSGSRP
jgi:hypothetical protein